MGERGERVRVETTTTLELVRLPRSRSHAQISLALPPQSSSLPSPSRPLPLLPVFLVRPYSQKMASTRSSMSELGLCKITYKSRPYRVRFTDFRRLEAPRTKYCMCVWPVLVGPGRAGPSAPGARSGGRLVRESTAVASGGAERRRAHESRLHCSLGGIQLSDLPRRPYLHAPFVRGAACSYVPHSVYRRNSIQSARLHTTEPVSRAQGRAAHRG
ncbi:hypothetical protein BV20DRAFT_873583 [Pilatotrama ljubarskyi]|nr:hypothetical protein BV20DRAFT_873583 [Pilatotrama ljubarskyi]